MVKRVRKWLFDPASRWSALPPILVLFGLGCLLPKSNTTAGLVLGFGAGFFLALAFARLMSWRINRNAAREAQPVALSLLVRRREDDEFGIHFRLDLDVMTKRTAAKMLRIQADALEEDDRSRAAYMNLN